MKFYQISLPVFKQGDDMAYHLESSENDKEAFIALSEQYKECSRICFKLSEYVDKGLKIVDAGTHMISVEGPEELMETLEKESFIWSDGKLEDCDEYYDSLDLYDSECN